MNHARTRRLTAGAVVTTLLGALFTLVVMQPAQAATCGTSTITLGVSKSGLIRADSAAGARGTLVATATITEGGSPDPARTVTFIISGDNTATASPNQVVTSGDPAQPSPPFTPGQYKSTITAGNSPGGFTVTATYVTQGGTTCSESRQVVQFGDPTSVALTLTPNQVPVSGLSPSTSAAVATVTDSGGRRVNDVTVTFTVGTPDPVNQPGGAATAKATIAPRSPSSSNNVGDGTYTETVNASSDPSRQQIIATVTASGGAPTTAPSGSATLTQYGDPATILLSFAPPTIVANGATSTTATAAVKDVVGNAVPGETVSFIKTTGPSVTFTPGTATATTDSSGNARVTIGGATTAGTASITALCQSAPCQNTQDLVIAAPVPTTVSLSLSPSSIPADGKSTSVATATVTDQVGVALAGASVIIDRPGRLGLLATDQGGGVYRATLTAGSSPAAESITATATKSGVSKTSNAVILTQTDAPTTTTTAPATTTTTAPGGGGGSSGQGYSLVGEDGSLYAFGTAKNVGDMKGKPLNAPIINVAYTPGGNGYWLVAKDGGIFTFGDADFYGSMGGTKLNSPVIGMAATPTGKGYWLFAGDGGIFTFGDAEFFGSMGDQKLNAPVINMEPLESGNGYWLVAGDGGIFTFGRAEFFGSMGDQKINQPVFDMTSTDTDRGYWLVARDGGIFSFGDAEPKFFGSAVNETPRPTKVIGMDSTPGALGYWIADASGKVYKYGNAQDLGDRYQMPNPAPMIGFASVPGVKP